MHHDALEMVEMFCKYVGCFGDALEYFKNILEALSNLREILPKMLRQKSLNTSVFQNLDLVVSFGNPLK